MNEKPVDYWCSNCDAVTVKENDESTGKFFYHWGHISSGKRGDKLCVLMYNEYVEIQWAICTTCLPEWRERMSQGY